MGNLELIEKLMKEKPSDVSLECYVKDLICNHQASLNALKSLARVRGRPANRIRSSTKQPFTRKKWTKSYAIYEFVKSKGQCRYSEVVEAFGRTAAASLSHYDCFEKLGNGKWRVIEQPTEQAT